MPLRTIPSAIILIILLDAILASCIDSDNSAAKEHSRIEQSGAALSRSEDYKEIDTHALNTPMSKMESIESLASYLIEPAKNDREKARAIYRWVTENIDYDVQGLLKGDYGDTSPKGVLKSGKSVCSGYSGLFEGLADAAGLEVVTINGYAKGYNYTPGMVFSGPTNHAWNAIKIDGSWYLLDSTWGAGYVDGRRFVRRYDDHYFLTPPEEFIYGHLPDDPKWQLLDDPVSKEKFEDLAYLKSGFFDLGMELGNQESCIISSDSEADISLYAPEDVLIMAKLDRAVESSDESPRRVYGEAALVQRAGELYILHLLPPSPGDYILTIFAKRKSDEGNYWDVAKYKVVEASGSNRSFPAVFDGFFALELRLDDPTNGTIEADGSANITLYAPDDVLMMAGLEKVGSAASSSKASSNKRTSTFVQRLDDRYVISLLPPASGEYTLTIFAKRKNDKGSYEGVMQYNVSASSGSKIGFPETFGDFNEKDVYLYTPLTGELPTGPNQTFRLLIPAAEDAVVISDENWYHLKESGDVFQGQAVLKKGEIDVAARFPGKSEYSTLLRYKGV